MSNIDAKNSGYSTNENCMVNIDLSEWPRLLEPKRSVFSLRKNILVRAFPNSTGKWKRGSALKLPGASSTWLILNLQKPFIIYNEQAVMQRLNDDGCLGSQNLYGGRVDATIRRMCWKTY